MIMQMTPLNQSLFYKSFGLCLKNWILFCKLAPKICVWSNVSLGRKSAISLKVVLNTSEVVP